MTGTITLPDAPELVWKMMRYFYALDYSASEQDEEAPEKTSLWSLQFHASMYRLADKYQNVSLMLLAADKFTFELVKEFGSGETHDREPFLDLMSIFEYVCGYSDAATNDLLQEAVIATVVDYLDVLIFMPKFKDVLMRLPEVGFKIIVKQVEQGQKPRENEPYNRPVGRNDRRQVMVWP